MPKSSLATFGRDVKNFRGNKTLRVAAEEAEVSAATLTRVESGRIPDVETFAKLCGWMAKDPKVYLGLGSSVPAQTHAPKMETIGVHMKVDRQPQEATVRALAKMILYAVNRQRSSDVIDAP